MESIKDLSEYKLIKNHNMNNRDFDVFDNEENAISLNISSLNTIFTDMINNSNDVDLSLVYNSIFIYISNKVDSYEKLNITTSQVKEFSSNDMFSILSNISMIDLSSNKHSNKTLFSSLLIMLDNYDETSINIIFNNSSMKNLLFYKINLNKKVYYMKYHIIMRSIVKCINNDISIISLINSKFVYSNKSNPYLLDILSLMNIDQLLHIITELNITIEEFIVDYLLTKLN